MAGTFRTVVGAGALFLLSLSPVSAEVVGVVQSVTQRDSEAAAINRALHDRVTDGWYRVQILSTPEEVVLQGQVDNQRTRESVLSAARSVVAKPVRDELTVKSPISDEEIARDLKRALEQEYPALVNNVDVSVQNGVAHLSGNLKNHREVDEVLAAAMGQKGVHDIQSDITVRGRPYPAPESRLKGEGKY